MVSEQLDAHLKMLLSSGGALEAQREATQAAVHLLKLGHIKDAGG